MRLAFMLATMILMTTQAPAALAARNLEIRSDATRHALVIGNNGYQNVGQLEKADNDARAMGKALERIGYETTVLLDANRRAMNAAINRFVDDIAGGGEGVLFFAGHGVQINNQNYLLPVDIDNPRNEADVGDQAVSLQGIQDKIAQAHARFTLLVIDACRNNPLPKKAGRNLGGTRGMALASSAEGQMVIFSAGANQLALDKLTPDDPDPNGVFTRELLPWLGKPGVSVRQAVQEVRRAVYVKAKSVNHDQFPAVYDQVLGDFYFVPRANEPAPTAAAPTPAVAPVAMVPAPALPAAIQPTAAAMSSNTRAKPQAASITPIAPAPPVPAPAAAARPALGYAALGLPGYRGFWNRETSDSYTKRMRAVMEKTGNGVLDMAPQGLDMDRDGFEAWWNEPEQSPLSRALCAASPQPRALLAARVETPPVFFTDVESAYWPELKLRLVVCADLRNFRQSKTLSPHTGEPWPFSTELNGELEDFLRSERSELAN